MAGWGARWRTIPTRGSRSLGRRSSGLRPRRVPARPSSPADERVGYPAPGSSSAQTGLASSRGGTQMALVGLEIAKRGPYADGQAFGAGGVYERIDGIARFAVDPAHQANQPIVD